MSLKLAILLNAGLFLFFISCNQQVGVQDEVGVAELSPEDEFVAADPPVAVGASNLLPLGQKLDPFLSACLVSSSVKFDECDRESPLEVGACSCAELSHLGSDINTHFQGLFAPGGALANTELLNQSSRLVKTEGAYVGAPAFARVSHVESTDSADHYGVELYYADSAGVCSRLTVYEAFVAPESGKMKKMHFLHSVGGFRKIQNEETMVKFMLRLNADFEKGIAIAEMGDAPVTYPADTLMQIDISSVIPTVTGAYLAPDKAMTTQHRSDPVDVEGVGVFRIARSSIQAGYLSTEEWNNINSLVDPLGTKQTEEAVDESLRSLLEDVTFVTNGPVNSDSLKEPQGGYTYGNILDLSWPATQMVDCSCLETELETGKACGDT